MKWLLTMPEASVEVTGFAGEAVHRAANKRQRVVKAQLQFRRDDILVQNDVRPRDVFGEPQNEIALLEAFRNLDKALISVMPL